MPPETTTYAWDNENRLIEVDKAGAVHRYEYDYRTRRISREEPPAGGGAAVKTAVVFAGGLSVAEYVANAATPTVEYVRGPDLGGGVGGMLYTLRPEGGTLAAKYSYANGRGDVVAQANQGGTVTWTASYEAFGTRKLETGTNADRQRANTKEEDPTGLLNEGFRYRDLETGTWLSRDPAGFVDGPNLYAYVRCNPWSKFDPLGLWEAVPVPTDASFRQKMASTWENVKRGFGALPSEYANGLANAKQQVRDAQLPKGLKLIAKAGLVAGEAGHGSNPLIGVPDMVETAKALKSDFKGTVSGIANGMVSEFREDSEMGMMKLAALPFTIKGIKNARKPNLNSNDATSNFGLYEIETPAGLEKVGKADLNRVTQSSGLPTRLHQQVRELEKTHGQGNVMGSVVQDLGETTTAAAKAAENTRIKTIVDETGQVPPGNRKSYRP